MVTTQRRQIFRPLVAFASLTFSCAATAQTITVGQPGSGAMFSSIQDGINAAPPGGAVLVAAGHYSTPVTLLIDKPLTVLGAGWFSTSYTAETGGTATPRLPLRVAGLRGGEQVVVAGLTLISQLSFFSNGPLCFLVEDCAGPVVLADLYASGAGWTTPFEAVGVVRDSAMVTLERCQLQPLYPGNAAPLPALLVERALVHVNACQMVGTSAPLTFGAPAFDGAPGILAIDATVRIARSDIAGGLAAQISAFSTPTVTKAGGAGIEAIASEVLIRGGAGNRLRGGRGGTALLSGVNVSGPGGPALRLDAQSLAATTPEVDALAGLDGNLQLNTPTIDGPGLFAPLAHVLPTMAGTSVLVTPGSTAVFAVASEPGAVCLPLLALDLSTGFTLPGVLGLFTLGGSGMVALAALTLPVSGTANVQLPVPPVAALAGTIVHGQTLSFGPSGWIAVSGPTSFAVR